MAARFEATKPSLQNTIEEQLAHLENPHEESQEPQAPEATLASLLAHFPSSIKFQSRPQNANPLLQTIQVESHTIHNNSDHWLEYKTEIKEHQDLDFTFQVHPKSCAVAPGQDVEVLFKFWPLY